jgi:intracellular sulfur oxidation DsrE/DsrF family protein
MKRYKNNIPLFILILFASALAFNASAQSTPCTGGNTEKKYALLVRSTEHMGAALKTASQMKASGKKYDAFEVVVCGKVVQELTDKENKQIPDMLTQAKTLNVTFTVCGMSLDKFKLSSDQLPDQFEVVENGIIRIFELQDNCYHTIEL